MEEHGVGAAGLQPVPRGSRRPEGGASLSLALTYGTSKALLLKSASAGTFSEVHAKRTDWEGSKRRGGGEDVSVWGCIPIRTAEFEFFHEEKLL